MNTRTAEWAERVAVITGGASGIGAAIARRWHRAGAQVMISESAQ